MRVPGRVVGAADPRADRGGGRCDTWTRCFDRAELAECQGPLYGGVDIGRCRDLTVMWVLEAQGPVLVTRGVRESVDEPFREQYQALRGLLSLRQVARCCIDAGGIGMALAEAAVEEFGGTRVEPVTFTSAMKDELASRLRLRSRGGHDPHPGGRGDSQRLALGAAERDGGRAGAV